MNIAGIVSSISRFYVGLIVVYILMSWFPISGVIEDIYRVLASIVEPYLSVFRRIIPPIGMIDISPIIAIVVLQLLTGVLVNILSRL